MAARPSRTGGCAAVKWPFAAAALAIVAGSLSAEPALAALRFARLERASHATSTDSWLDLLIEFTKRIIIILGGDPTELDRAADADAAMSIITSYWLAYGLPGDLTLEERIELIADVEDAQIHLILAPSEVDAGVVEEATETLSEIRDEAIESS